MLSDYLTQHKVKKIIADPKTRKASSEVYTREAEDSNLRLKGGKRYERHSKLFQEI